MSAFPRDLLPNLTPQFLFSRKLKEEDEEEEQEQSGETEEIELTLGLSTNGRFGIDPAATKLTRSSSIPDLLNPSMEPSPPPPVSMLLRTCSLPVETEEETKKRKEIQSLRRLEAKRKRTEKQKSFKGSCFSQQEQTVKVLNWASVVPNPPQLPRPLSQQGSIGSQGSGPSGVSESDSLQLKGMNKASGAGSPTSPNSIVESMGKPPRCVRSLSNAREMSSNGQHTISSKESMKMARNVLENLPCVSSKGDGPDGKRIEGFLYRYQKGEDVRIVCVCHGSFLSPVEFVRHAGGGDVAHPLRHIVVNHSPLL